MKCLKTPLSSEEKQFLTELFKCARGICSPQKLNALNNKQRQALEMAIKPVFPQYTNRHLSVSQISSPTGLGTAFHLSQLESARPSVTKHAQRFCLGSN